METDRTYRGGGDAFYHQVSGWKVQISLVQTIICINSAETEKYHLFSYFSFALHDLDESHETPQQHVQIAFYPKIKIMLYIKYKVRF